MGNSSKKAITKIKGYLKEKYHRIIRRVTKQDLKENKDLRNPKEIINDYDYIDYISDCENNDYCYCIKNYGFKKCKLK